MRAGRELKAKEAPRSRAQGGRLLMVSAVNETVRNNIFHMLGNSSHYPIYGVQVAERGVEPVPSSVEV